MKHSKFLSLFLALLTAVALLVALPEQAQAAKLTEDIYTYTVSNGNATITDVDANASGAIVIPSTIGGYPVTEIGESAFAWCEKITSVTIPSTVTTIAKKGFYSCSALASVTIPDSVTTIGENAF